MSEDTYIGRLGSKAKQIVYNVWSYFDQEFNRKPGQIVMDKVEKATGVNPKTVYRIRKEQEQQGILKSPVRQKRGSYKSLDSFDYTVLRNEVTEFYTVHRQLPTLAELHSVLKADINYP